MKQFFIDLLSDKPGTAGTKRFAAMWGLLLLTVEVIVHLSTNKPVQWEIIFATLIVILTPLGLNAAIALKQTTERAKLATTIVEQNPPDENAKDAKDIINQDNPIQEKAQG